MLGLSSKRVRKTSNFNILNFYTIFDVKLSKHRNSMRFCDIPLKNKSLIKRNTEIWKSRKPH